MTPRAIFTIILKIFGLWLILGLIQVFPNAIGVIPMMTQGDMVMIAIAVSVLTVALGIYLLIIWLLLFKTGFIIDKLSLDKHFDQPSLEINIEQHSVIQISIIILGGLIFIDALPLFISEIFTYIRQKQFEGTLIENPGFKFMIITGIKLLLGYLLMSNSKYLTNWIDKKQKNNNG